MKTEPLLLLAIVFSSPHPDYTAQDVGNILDSGNGELDAVCFRALLALPWCLKQVELSQIFKGHPQQSAYALRLQSVAFNCKTLEVFLTSVVKTTDNWRR